MDEKRYILKAEGVTKTFAQPETVHVFRNLSLAVEPGESIAIMGRSGEGKSTLLNILGTLEDADSGSLMIAGNSITPSNKVSIRNNHMGFIFQSFHLLEHFTAIENILMPARIGRQSCRVGSDAYQRAYSLLEEVGLGDRAHFHTNVLSGGEKQRIAIARAFINDPDIILADEPTGNLDHSTSRQIQELLLSFARMLEKSLIVVTHDEELASRCSQRYHLSDGALHQ